MSKKSSPSQMLLEIGKQDTVHNNPVRCFVIMPSGNHNEYARDTDEANFIFDKIIKPSVIKALGNNVNIEREMDSLKTGAIDKNIVSKTARSEYAIVDITGQNPNVFFELGMRYVFKPRTTILIRQKGSYIPFDITSYRCIEYDLNLYGPEQAVIEISNAIKSSSFDQNHSDSLVYDVFPNLYVNIDHKNLHTNDTSMPWHIFWSQVNLLSDIIKKSLIRPEYILGISNGGLLIADSISRISYNGEIPVICLWADRNYESTNYFDNDINASIIDLIIHKNKSSTIFVFDDVADSGQTLRHSLNFLKSKSSSFNIYIAPLFCRNRKYLVSNFNMSLWNDSLFTSKLGDQIDHNVIYTNFQELPYHKQINHQHK